MPGLEKCRLCGECCVGCIFLNYDKKRDLLGCLIYGNKHRKLVTGWHVYSHFQKGNQGHLKLFFEELLDILNEENDPDKTKPGMCDHYLCWNMLSKNEALSDIRKNGFFRELQLTEAKIQQSYRNRVSDFAGLLEVLNG